MRIQIFANHHKEGKAKKTGNDYNMDIAQCLVHPDVEGELPFVGELTLPKGTKAEDIKPGFYTPSFRIGKSIDGKIVGNISHLTAVPESRVQPPKAGG